MSKLLVQVCKITDVQKHFNADKLDIIQCLGWNCIVGRDQYKVGDLVVFFPPDCILPDTLIEKYELTYLKNGGRTGTIKLRGAISQGLVLDMNCLPSGKYFDGDNVAEILNIKKWQPPERGTNFAQGNPISRKRLNPYFDKYTDIDNIKNYPNVFEYGETVVITEKIHGSNFRAGYLPIIIDSAQPLKMRIKLWFKKFILRETHEFVYGSHNVQLHGNLKTKNWYGEDMWGRVAEKYNLAKIIPKDTIIYGEVYGKGVQDLTYGLEDIDLVVFDIKQNGKYLSWFNVTDMCLDLGLRTVPVLFIGHYTEQVLKDHTDGKSELCLDQIREGCVVKSLWETNDARIGRKILKSVSVDYLTRKGGTEYH